MAKAQPISPDFQKALGAEPGFSGKADWTEFNSVWDMATPAQKTQILDRIQQSGFDFRHYDPGYTQGNPQQLSQDDLNQKLLTHARAVVTPDIKVPPPGVPGQVLSDAAQTPASSLPNPNSIPIPPPVAPTTPPTDPIVARDPGTAPVSDPSTQMSEAQWAQLGRWKGTSAAQAKEDFRTSQTQFAAAQANVKPGSPGAAAAATPPTATDYFAQYASSVQGLAAQLADQAATNLTERGGSTPTGAQRQRATALIYDQIKDMSATDMAHYRATLPTAAAPAAANLAGQATGLDASGNPLPAGSSALTPLAPKVATIAFTRALQEAPSADDVEAKVLADQGLRQTQRINAYVNATGGGPPAPEQYASMGTMNDAEWNDWLNGQQMHGGNGLTVGSYNATRAKWAQQYATYFGRQADLPTISYLNSLGDSAGHWMASRPVADTPGLTVGDKVRIEQALQKYSSANWGTTAVDPSASTAVYNDANGVGASGSVPGSSVVP